MVLPRIFQYSVEERKKLIETINGHRPADMVIVNANIVSTPTGEVIEDSSIIVVGKRIAGFGNYSDLHKYVGDNTLIVNAENRYVIPGFIDPHIHIESSLLTPTGFAKLALKHGTTTIVADPHEIGNVAGIEGIMAFIEEASRLPLKILVDIPSCVPPVDPMRGLETPGNILGVDEVEKLAELEGVYGLGEVMDFISVVEGDKGILEKIRVAYKHGLRINGHAPLLSGTILDAYINAGIHSDHETLEVREALEKLRKGMYIFIREGSAWKDLERLIKIVLDDKIDCRFCCFTSDDLNILDLYEKGHMDRIVNEAIEMGLDPIKAIQLATINPATWLHLEEHIGIIAPGRLADLVFTRDLNYIEAETVIANGEIIYYKGELKKGFDLFERPSRLLKTVNIDRRFKPDDLIVKLDKRVDEVSVNVIEVYPGSTLTRRRVERLEVSNGFIKADPSRDIMYVAVIERHHGIGSIGKGFIKGLRFKAGAIAQTIAHDTHNLVVAGNDPGDMVKAIERIVELQGGIVVVDDGEIVSEIELRYGGLMSIKEPEQVYSEYRSLVNKMKEEYGLSFEAFFMTLSLISLPVIPEIRLTDRGLVDVNKAKLIPLIVDKNWLST